MKQNVKVAKQLLKLAKSLMASDDKNKYAIIRTDCPNSSCLRYPEDDDNRPGQEDFFDEELANLIKILIAILRGKIVNTHFTRKGIIFKGKNLIDEILKRLKGIKHPLIKDLIDLIKEVQSVFDKYGIPSRESKDLSDQIERLSKKIGII